MRRILAGVVAFTVGLAADFYGRSILPPRGAVAAGFAVAIATYGFIDWLGLLPQPFDRTARSLLHDDQSSDRDGRS